MTKIPAANPHGIHGTFCNGIFLQNYDKIHEFVPKMLPDRIFEKIS